MNDFASQSKKQSIAVLFKEGDINGQISIRLGKIDFLSIEVGDGHVKDSKFRITSSDSARLDITFADVVLQLGANSTIVNISTSRGEFSFFMRDVSATSPIWLPEFGIAVTEKSDNRSYNKLAEDIRKKGFVSQLQQFEVEPEETYENACKTNRDMLCPTWLGLSRDMRIFRVEHIEDFGYWGTVKPCYHTFQVKVKEMKVFDPNGNVEIRFMIGPGEGCSVDMTRRLEDGVLPIVRSTQIEGDVQYDITAFATLENQPLATGNIRGTNWQAAYANTRHNMLSENERKDLSELLTAETDNRDEEVVCCIRARAINTSRVPRYAWFKAGMLTFIPPKRYDGTTGFALDFESKVCAINLINGSPMPQSEMAILLAPGQAVTMDILIPHHPISPSRAEKLAHIEVPKHLQACREYWQKKLSVSSQIYVPEKTINESIRAGLLNCDINALGMTDTGPILATVGWYGPIGSESSPIIQFFDSMGWHDLAERAIDFFLVRQHENGFMQNFHSYELETGPVLWTMGEHYRYTREDNWVRRVRTNIIKACNYLIDWRKRNKTSELRKNGCGFGMLNGKVSDTNDFFHSFMLNAVSYLGIKRSSEMLQNVDSSEAERLAKEAAEFREDIRNAYIQSVAKAPVIPAGDGSWVPTAPPWPDYCGPLSLYAEGGEWETHCAFCCRDSLTGPIWLVIGEVLDADEPLTEMLLKFNQVLFTKRNAARSQPYYCRHDYVHLKRHEVKAFLKTYYNQFSALADRETYTFWEHYHGDSQNKTHETAWFLMQTRWMLYLEEKETLNFLRGIPRRWLENGKSIALKNVATYFGPASLTVESKLAENIIKATVSIETSRRPTNITIRLPHPQGQKAISCHGGLYAPESETVYIENFSGKAEIELRFC